MSGIPNSWSIAALSEITIDCAQRVPGPSDQFFYVDIASIDRLTKRIVNPQHMSGAQAPSRARKVIRAEDILVSMTRPNLNAVAMVPPELNDQIASTGLDVIRVIMVAPKWVFYSVRTKSFVEYVSGLVQGALYPAVRSKDVRAYVTPIAPLAEQKRITDKLDTLIARVDACRERMDRVPAIVRRFKQSVLAAATSGELTKTWREENACKATLWRSCQLRDLALLITKGASPKWQGFPYVEAGTDGVLFVTSENIRDLHTDLTKPKYVDASINIAQRRSILKKGDLLTNIVGGSIGRSAIFESDERANINQAVCLIRLKDDVERRFILYALSSPSVVAYMHGEKVDVARANLSLEDIGNITVVLPSTVEQKEIVRRVDSLFAIADQLLRRFGAIKTFTDRIYLATLSKAFRGELVPQNSSDEPASVLLARIKAAHAAASRVTRRRQRTAPKAQAELPKSASTPTSKRASSPQTPHARPRRPPAPEPDPEDTAAIDRRPLEDYTTDEMMSHFRAASRASGEMTEEGLFHLVLARLGFERLGAKVTPILKGHLKAAIGRGIIERDGFFVRGKTPTIKHYERSTLVDALTSVMRKNHPYEREEVIQALAVHLGYSSVSDVMRDTMKSVFNSAIRQGVLIREGSTIRRTD